MTFISYAQNFEDVLLWRAFHDVERGQYIDIGAQDPVVDSVSLAFYEAGWRGIHVEPVPAYAARLREARPDETIIEAVVSEAAGPVPFFEIPDTGISTGREDIAGRHSKAGFRSRKMLAPAVRLDRLLEMVETDIHWMKVDVEGMELDVLRSWGESKKRPWVLVIEATYPSTQERTDHLWQHEVVRRGYQQAFFDGLSCYFVHKDHSNLASRLAAPANVYDGFGIAAHHFASFKLRGDTAAAENQTRSEKERADWFEREAAKSREAHDLAWREQVAAVERLNAAEQAHRDVLQNLVNEHHAASDRMAQQNRETDQELRREFRQQEEELRKAVREAEKETAHARVELARLEERNSHAQASLERSERSLEQAQQSLGDTKRSLYEAESRLRQSTRETTELKGALDRSRGELERGAAHLAHLEWEHAQERERNRAEIEQSHREIERLRAEREDFVSEIECLRTASASEIGQLRFNLTQAAELIAAAVSERPGRWQRIGALLGFARPSRAIQHLAGWAPNPVHHSPELSSTQEYHPTMSEFAYSHERNPYIRADSLAELFSWEDVDFVRCAYVTILGRQPDEQGEAFYSACIRSGYSKAQILWDLRSSTEGRRHDPGIAGLDRALRRARRARTPLIGWLFRLFSDEEGGSAASRRHRAVMNHLGRIVSLQQRLLEAQQRFAARPAMVMPVVPVAANDRTTDAEPRAGAASLSSTLVQISDVAPLSAGARKLFDSFTGAS